MGTVGSSEHVAPSGTMIGLVGFVYEHIASPGQRTGCMF